MKAVDLFAGFGGFTLGAEMAGVEVVWAANHWALAVQTHAANHPDVEHVCQDLRQADWTALPQDVDLVLAGPACQGHSEASQPKRRPYHDAMRATAWAVIDCVEVVRPRAVVVENVPAFRRWELYPLWVEALRRLGYGVEEHVLLASRHGVPQRRERLFVAGVRGKAPRLKFRSKPEVPFGPCIDWSAGGWRPVSSAMPGTKIRIAKGRANHGRRFLSQHVTGHPGVPLSEPIRTITTKEMWVLVDGDRYRRLTERELARGMSFPDSFTWPAAPRWAVLRGLGNAIPPLLARDVVSAVAEAA